MLARILLAPDRGVLSPDPVTSLNIFYNCSSRGLPFAEDVYEFCLYNNYSKFGGIIGYFINYFAFIYPYLPSLLSNFSYSLLFLLISQINLPTSQVIQLPIMDLSMRAPLECDFGPEADLKHVRPFSAVRVWSMSGPRKSYISWFVTCFLILNFVPFLDVLKFYNCDGLFLNFLTLAGLYNSGDL